ncbi:MAG: alpha/beta hydrolase-fold protein, partial [Polyangiaceae bacterium]
MRLGSSPRRWPDVTRGLFAALALGCVIAAALDGESLAAEGRPQGARIAFARDGRVGAWLVAGPVDGLTDADEEQLAPSLNAAIDAAPGAPRWRLASTNGALTLARVLDAKTPGTGYAGGILHLEHGGRFLLVLGGGAALTVIVDGRSVYARSEVLANRDVEDLISLDLAEGDHTVVLAIHRHTRSSTLRARWLDDTLRPPQDGGWLLPGASAEDARVLASTMSSVAVDRGMEMDGYRPKIAVTFPSGAPRDVTLDVRVRLTPATVSGAGSPALVDVDEGEVPLDARSAGERVFTLPLLAGPEVEDRDWTLLVDIAGRTRTFPFYPRRAVREAAARALRATRGAIDSGIDASSLASVEHLRERITRFVAQGDADVAAELDDARELRALAMALEQKRDPYGSRRDESGTAGPWKTGPMRRAYRSPADGQLSEFAVYVPPDFDPKRSYPLIVALHGMNGHPMEMLMWLFGHDDPSRDGTWEDRHPIRDLPVLEAIVVAPGGHFNAMYRGVGEDDVMSVVDWAMATYPIDPARVTITGPSMGGIGAAACALHYPSRFAAAEPLCGYQSYFIRSDIAGRTLRPWEKLLAEERSNVFWAENGLNVPLYIVHGTQDLPEENSGVLIDRYLELGYAIKDEHPDLGHNVWQTTYEDLKGALWLLPHRRPSHPRVVRFKTPRTRWADDAWLHVRQLSSSEAWGEVTARIDPDNAIHVVTQNVSALALDRDTVRIDDAAPVKVTLDGRTLVFQAGEPIDLHKDGAGWTPGPVMQQRAGERTTKHGHMTGPIRDVFHEPILFVWGDSDPDQARANEEVARTWARGRGGVTIDYPVISDTEFYARSEALANDRALFLVGNAKSNRVVRELEPDFPIRVDGDDIVLGTSRISRRDGAADRSQLGAIFIRPNPRRPDRYVVVVEGVGPLGTWRSLSLPDLLPDYVLFDEGVTPAMGHLLLGSGDVRAGGFFGSHWE